MRFRRQITAFAAALAITLPLSAFRETLRPPSMAEKVVVEMNVERAAHGLPALRINDQLSAAATDRIADMFGKHYFAHVSPDGIEPWSWVDRHGYNYRHVGENLAVGYPTAASVVDGWMHSAGHRANLLGKTYDEVGVAVAQGSPTHTFRGPTVVALYGER